MCDNWLRCYIGAIEKTLFYMAVGCPLRVTEMTFICFLLSEADGAIAVAEGTWPLAKDYRRLWAYLFTFSWYFYFSRCPMTRLRMSLMFSPGRSPKPYLASTC